MGSTWGACAELQCMTGGKHSLLSHSFHSRSDCEGSNVVTTVDGAVIEEAPRRGGTYGLVESLGLPPRPGCAVGPPPEMLVGPPPLGLDMRCQWLQQQRQLRQQQQQQQRQRHQNYQMRSRMRW